MDAQTAFFMVRRSGIVAVLRGAFPPRTAVGVVRALLTAHINVIEFTMNSEQPIEAMQAVKREWGDDVCCGMGTILTADVAQTALDAGADFIVSPATIPGMIEAAQRAGRMVVPGVMTPTEIALAWGQGATFQKLFPAGNLGVDYFRSVRAALDQVKFTVNGGITEENAPQFLKAGAVACGMGSWLTGDGSLPIAQIEARAQQLRETVSRVLQPV